MYWTTKGGRQTRRPQTERNRGPSKNSRLCIGNSSAKCATYAHPFSAAREHLDVRSALVGKAHLNRDINASRNIGLQLERLLDDKPLIHELTDEDIEFNEHRLCVACEE